MVQADPIITEIYNPQNWNPYSYVLNNPLNLTDPSGYSFLDRLLHPFKNVIRSVMRALGPDVSGALIGACSFVPGAWSIACAAGAGYDHARAFGASSSDARRSGVAAAFSAAVAWGVKTYGGNLGSTSRIAIAATSGGVASVIQGGKFGHGFVSAGVTARASPYVSSMGDVYGTAASAIIGGTVSEMTGGKFANGARSGAFAYVVGKAMQRASSGAARDAGTKTSEDNPRVGLLAAEEARAALYDAGVLSKIYKGDFKVASEDWARLVDPIARKYNVEISSLLYQIGENLFVYAAPYSDGNSSQVIVRAGPRLPEQYGGKIIGYIHTHPSSAALSSDDRSIAWDMRESAGHTVYAISVYRGAPGTVWDTFNRRDILWKDF
jgi:hypothetical protein